MPLKGFTLILLMLTRLLTAQPASADHIITKELLIFENGKTSRQVKAGLQDSEGFVWLSTSYGIQRYDGKDFKLFSKEKNGLQSNDASSISESDDHLLWIRYAKDHSRDESSGSVDILDLATHEIKPLHAFFGSQLPFPEHSIRSITSNEKRELAIYTEDRNGPAIYLYSSKTGFKKLSTTRQVSPCCPPMFRGNTILYGTGDHHFFMLSKTGEETQARSERRNLAPVGISKTGRMYFHSLPAEELGDGREMYNSALSELFMNGDSRTLPVQFFDKFTQNSIAEFLYAFHDAISGNSVLYSKNKGVYLFDEGNYLSLNGGIINEQLNSVYDYFTVNGQHWLCTNNGVYILSIKKNVFTHYFNAGSVEQGSEENPFQIRSIFEDKQGDLIVNCWKGLYKVKDPESAQPQYERLVKTKSTAYDGFYIDPGNNLWIGGRKAPNNNGLVRYNLVNGQTSCFTYPAGDLWAAYLSGKKLLFGGASTGILILEHDSIRRMRPCMPAPAEPGWIYQFFKSRDNTLWCVSKNGLYEIDEAHTCIKTRYASDEPGGTQVPFKDLHFVHEDKQGIFWLASNGNGLIRWDRRNKHFKKFSVQDGFSSNVIYAILEDERGHLWLSSDYGIMCFDPATARVNIYTSEDGLTADECNRISYFRSEKGRMFFGGINGINAFYPRDLWADTSVKKFPLRIVSYYQFDGAKHDLVDKTNWLICNKQIVLKPGDDLFTIGFQLLNFDKGKNYFAYKIEGIDAGWIDINENSVRISNLPYGNYELVIKGRSQAGQWSTDFLHIPIFVLRPFYREWWFMLICVVGLIVIAAAFTWLRTRQLLKTKKRLENTIEERTGQLKNLTENQEKLILEKDTLLKEIHHRVKNNLQVISALLEMQGLRSDDKNIAAAISESRNRVLSISFIHQNLYQHDDLKGVEMKSFVRELSTHIHNVFQSPLCRVTVNADVPAVFLDIDTALPLGLILNELFTNSYKYAFRGRNEGAIHLELKELEQGVYYFKYHDNGIGLPADIDLKKTNSLGLKLIKQLSRQLGGNMRYVFEKGSKFELILKDLNARNKEVNGE